MLDLSRARERMIEVQIARRGVRDRQVLDAMRRVPREAFVESGFEEFAYEDRFRLVKGRRYRSLISLR